MATQTAPITLTRQGRVSVADLVIENEAANERALATVEKLMSRQDRTPEDDALLKVLTTQIEAFESKTYASSTATPEELILFLLEQNDQSPRDLEELAGGKSHLSEILSGKRSIGPKIALRLGQHFNISPAAFVTFK